MIETVITTAVTAAVSAFIGALVAAIIGRVKVSADTQKAIADGVKTLLRNELVAAHREWVEEKGFVTLEALEYIQDTYKCYHALKGNSSGTKLWEDINALPVKR